jgi:hypothetical protein
MTTTLTISLIVRDEEQSLGRCLDSVQGLGDEIVVVDTGSEDRTIGPQGAVVRICGDLHTLAGWRF